MASCKDCKFPCAYRGADDDYSNKDRPACAGAHLEAMKAARSEDRASRYDVTLLQSFDWEGDVLTRTLAERIGEDSDIHVLDHYQTDFTELREFLDAKRKGLELCPVVRCKDCWFYNAGEMFCSLHESDFSPDAFCSYASTDGNAEYWGLDKKDHDAKMKES